MFQIQLRYFQYILSASIVAGLLLDSFALITAAFVGIALTWLSEMLIAQFEIASEKYLVVMVILLLSFSSTVVLSFVESMELNVLMLLLIIYVLTFFLFQQDVNIYKIGNALFLLMVSFLLNGFFTSTQYTENISFIATLYVSILALKTLATYFNIQFSNFQFFFNFFGVFIVVVGFSSFDSYQTLDIVLAAITVATFTTLLNFLFIKIRFEYELTSSLTNQIYIFDFLIAFLVSIYAVDALNILNGLF
jgi:hypothetical protein